MAKAKKKYGLDTFNKGYSVDVKETYGDIAVCERFYKYISPFVIADIFFIRSCAAYGRKYSFCLNAERVLIECNKIFVRDDVIKSITFAYPS